MDKNKFYSVVVPVVMSLICVVLSLKAIVNSSQLQAGNMQLDIQKAKVISLDKQVAQLEAKLSEVMGMYDGEVRRINKLQVSLDAAREQIATLKADKSELKAKLNAALSEVDPSSTATVE